MGHALECMIPSGPLVLDRQGWRSWLESNHRSSSGCWLLVDRGHAGGAIPYLDAVEEALCFGWIDSTVRKEGSLHAQRFSPRRPGSNWTELNLERCRRLERLGLMTDAGREAIPDREFSIDSEIMEAIRSDPAASEFFDSLPDLYVRVRVGNIQMKRGTPLYQSRLDRFVDDCRRGRMAGNWDDGGRLSCDDTGSEQ